MAFRYESSPEQLAKMLTGALMANLQEEIRSALLAQVTPMLNEIAEELTRKLSGKVEAMSEIGGGLRVALVLNGEWKDVK